MLGWIFHVCPKFWKRPKEPTEPKRSGYGYLKGEGDLINKAMIMNCDDSRFLPCHLIAGLTERSKVKKSLEAAGVKQPARIAAEVSKRAQRIFLILMLMSTNDNEKLSLIGKLLTPNFTDAELPIEWVENDGEWSAYSTKATAPKPPRALATLSEGEWGRHCQELFELYQWKVTAPEFGGKEFIFSFHHSTILPYVEKPPKPASSGFFGEVSHYKIHSKHITMSVKDQEEGSVSVAIKKAINPEDLADFFTKETENLHRLKGHKWDNLIQPIAAYQRNGERCIIFPWASGGSLSQYWENTDLARSDKDGTLWIIGQFTGICRALKDLHDINCRHGDLKPDNILWFKDDEDMGELQIADLGLAAFHKDKNTNMRMRDAIQTMTPSGTQRYEPPETNEFRYSKQPRSRAYDIWSMGCILLELLIWLTYGNDAVGAFGRRTEFFWQIDSGIYVIHDIVQKCMESLEREFRGHQAHAELLALVRHELLVVQGRSSPGERSTAEKVHEKMDGILTKCKDEGQYLVTFKGKMSLPGCLTEARRDGRPVLHMRDGALAVPEQNERPAVPPANQQDLQFDNVRLDRQATMSSPQVSTNSLRVETPGDQEQYVGSSSSLIPRVNGTD
jgi:serine/threonine protein kinase